MTRIPVDEAIEYTRGGVTLRNVAVDERVLARQLPHSTEFTVVTQTVRAGTTVVRGTTVDVTVAVTRDLPVTIISDVPDRWQKFTIGDLADKARREPEILKILGDNPDAASLSENDRKKFVTFMDNAGLAGAGENVEAGFNLILGAHTLAGG